MQTKDDHLLERLLSIFKVEAAERFNSLSSGLIELEQAPNVDEQMQIIETIFRETHSLKGAAHAVSLQEIASVCQSMENVFAAIKRLEIRLSPELFDVLHMAVDTLSQMLSRADIEQARGETLQVQEVIRYLEGASKGVLPLSKWTVPQRAEEELSQAAGPEPPQPVVAERPGPEETIRIATVQLEAVRLKAEELLSAKLAAQQRVVELRDIGSTLAAWTTKWAKLRPIVWALEHAPAGNGTWTQQAVSRTQTNRLLEFLEWDHSLIRSLQDTITAMAQSSVQNRQALDTMVDDLLDHTKKFSMQRCSMLLESLPKVVRNLARDMGKDVKLVVHGADIELDRRILEDMRDPLMHMLRNCIAHGIETPEVRQRKGKPPRGVLTVAIAQTGDRKIDILVSDDGAGINLAKVGSAAVKLGMLSQGSAEKLDEQQMLSLIFRSGVTTSTLVTDTSGRGLGLAIVREKVEKLDGQVVVETQPDVGTTFRLTLRQRLATLGGVLVRVDEHLLVLPLSNVESVVRVHKNDIKTVERQKTVQLSGQTVSLVRLGDVLELPRKAPASDAADKLPVVVLRAMDRHLACIVDEIIHEQEVLVKSLGKQLIRVRNIAGATVLGTGRVVPVLNPTDLMKSAMKAPHAVRSPTIVVDEREAKRAAVLLVEDSITARMLLKNILEGAGYVVKTATDGVDAWATLKTEDIDVIVSDVDMPRMNGFDLTVKIRGDGTLADLPVVLVTALESHEDREHGARVGANAYIVKSSFDQSNLLEVISRLI